MGRSQSKNFFFHFFSDAYETVIGLLIDVKGSLMGIQVWEKHFLFLNSRSSVLGISNEILLIYLKRLKCFFFSRVLKSLVKHVWGLT